MRSALRRQFHQAISVLRKVSGVDWLAPGHRHARPKAMRSTFRAVPTDRRAEPDRRAKLEPFAKVDRQRDLVIATASALTDRFRVALFLRFPVVNPLLTSLLRCVRRFTHTRILAYRHRQRQAKQRKSECTTSIRSPTSSTFVISKVTSVDARKSKRRAQVALCGREHFLHQRSR